jgi:hypothetical protein
MNEREPFAKPIDVLRSRLTAYIDLAASDSSPLSRLRGTIEDLEWAIEVLERASAPAGNGTEVVVESFIRARDPAEVDEKVTMLARLIPVVVKQ